MKDYMEEQIKKLTETVSSLQEQLNTTKEVADASMKKADLNEEKIVNLSDKVLNLEKIVATQAIQIKVLQTRQEDQTCRNARNSVIIRGVEEEENEKWEDTRRIVCDTMAAKLDLQPNQLSGMIERIHRGKPPKNDGPRVIHARFFNWNHVETVKDKWWTNGKGTGIFVDQRYGPDTTFRRNKALAVRKELKTGGEIVGGYVKYPAKLFVKYRKTDKKYQLLDDFSNIPVPLPVEDDS